MPLKISFSCFAQYYLFVCLIVIILLFNNFNNNHLNNDGLFYLTVAKDLKENFGSLGDFIQLYSLNSAGYSNYSIIIAIFSYFARTDLFFTAELINLLSITTIYLFFKSKYKPENLLIITALFSLFFYKIFQTYHLYVIRDLVSLLFLFLSVTYFNNYLNKNKNKIRYLFYSFLFLSFCSVIRFECFIFLLAYLYIIYSHRLKKINLFKVITLSLIICLLIFLLFKDTFSYYLSRFSLDYIATRDLFLKNNNFKNLTAYWPLNLFLLYIYLMIKYFFNFFFLHASFYFFLKKDSLQNHIFLQFLVLLFVLCLLTITANFFSTGVMSGRYFLMPTLLSFLFIAYALELDLFDKKVYFYLNKLKLFIIALVLLFLISTCFRTNIKHYEDPVIIKGNIDLNELYTTETKLIESIIKQKINDSIVNKYSKVNNFSFFQVNKIKNQNSIDTYLANDDNVIIEFRNYYYIFKPLLI
jgi:hypothetical protein